MINKTSSIPFLKYGEIITPTDVSDRKNEFGFNYFHEVTAKTLNVFLKASEDIYLRCIKGLVMLVVSNDIKTGEYEEFMIHRVVKINKGVHYNFIAVTESGELEISTLKETFVQAILPNSTFIYKEIRPTFRVNRILSYYYSVRPTDYIFSGETTNYWELTFVDNGELQTTVNDTKYTIGNYDLILYAPGQFHNQMTSNVKTCSYLTVIFEMDIKYPQIFEDVIFHVNRATAKIINNFVNSTKSNDYYSKDLMVCYLQELLISLINVQEEEEHKQIDESITPMKQEFENELLDEIMLYVSENVYLPLTIQELCYQFSLSRSSLQKLFNQNLGISPKQYISDLKLKKSKELIKENKYNISEVSNMLGFTSIHYFSRVFKQHFGITPTDYAKTIYN